MTGALSVVLIWQKCTLMTRYGFISAFFVMNH